MPGINDKQREANRKAWEAAIAEAREKETALAISPSAAKPGQLAEEKDVVTFIPGRRKNHYDPNVLAAYAAYAKQHGLEIDKDNGALVFASQQDAVNFFNDQARLGYKFLAKKMHSDFHVFSCGNGKLYSGSLAEIKEELTKEFEKQPSDEIQDGLALIARAIQEETPNHTATMREKMQNQRSAEQETEPTVTPARR